MDFSTEWDVEGRQQPFWESEFLTHLYKHRCLCIVYSMAIQLGRLHRCWFQQWGGGIPGMCGSGKAFLFICLSPISSSLTFFKYSPFLKAVSKAKLFRPYVCIGKQLSYVFLLRQGVLCYFVHLFLKLQSQSICSLPLVIPFCFPKCASRNQTSFLWPLLLWNFALICQKIPVPLCFRGE